MYLYFVRNLISMISTDNRCNTRHKDDKVPFSGKGKFVPHCQQSITKQTPCKVICRFLNKYTNRYMQ